MNTGGSGFFGIRPGYLPLSSETFKRSNNRFIGHLLQGVRDLSSLSFANLAAVIVEEEPTADIQHNTEQMTETLGTIANLFTYSNFVHAISGSVGSFVAMSVFYPLDTARTLLQVDDHRKARHSPQVIAELFREEGILGLYRGWGPVVSTLCFSNFVYFYAYHGLKAVVLGPGKQPDSLSDLVIAFIAGAVNVIVTTPLWVANTRLKLQGAQLKTNQYKHSAASTKYGGIIDCLLKIYWQEGLAALWSGTLPSLVLASNPAIQFMVYEALKRYFQHSFHTAELSGLLYFIIGAVAKAVSTVVTYPLQVIQSRLRAGFAKAEKSYSMIEHLLLLVRTQGVHFLYKGMEAKLLQTILTAALMFVTYEKIAAFTFHLMGIVPNAT